MLLYTYVYIYTRNNVIRYIYFTYFTLLRYFIERRYILLDHNFIIFIDKKKINLKNYFLFNYIYVNLTLKRLLKNIA